MFVAANGQQLTGGDHIVDISLEFKEKNWAQPRNQKFLLQGEFFTANIDVDLIISYHWLRKNNLGVFPHLEVLAWENPYLHLLKGGREDPTPAYDEYHIDTTPRRKSWKKKNRKCYRLEGEQASGLGDEELDEILLEVENMRLTLPPE